MTRYELTGPDGDFAVEVDLREDGYHVNVAGEELVVRLKRGETRNSLVAELSDKPVRLDLLEAPRQRVEMVMGGERLAYFRRSPVEPVKAATSTPVVQRGVVGAPMPGKVVQTLVRRGERVGAGDPLVVIESMKMEIAVRADRDAEVEEVMVAEGTAVKRGQALVRLG